MTTKQKHSEDPQEAHASQAVKRGGGGPLLNWWGYLVAIASVALATWLKYLAQPTIIPADVPITYLLAIVLTAFFFGLAPSVLACLLSVAAFDIFFVPPLSPISPNGLQELPRLVILLLVGLIFSYLASRLRQKNVEAKREIDARKQSEAELLNYRDALAAQVNQRAAELEKVNLKLQDEIREHKVAEEVIKLSNQRWQETFDALPDLVSIHDKNFTITKVNAAFARVFGMPIEQLVGKKCYEIFHKTAGPILGCPLEQTHETGQLKREEIFEPTQNAYFDVITAPVVSIGGEITSSVHIARDITERKRATEQAAFQSGLLDTIEDAVILIDAERRIAYWGKGAANLLGWNPEEIIGRDAATILIPEPSARQTETIDGILRSGRSWAGEFTARRRDGTQMPFLVHSSPVMSENRMIGIIAVGQDITELKKVDKMKDEFIGLISHELRTPLTIITGSLQSAMYPGVSAEDARELVQNAAEGADSLADILENMLELSRHQAGRLMLHIEPVDITGVVKHVIEKLERQAVSQRFLVTLPADLPRVEADPLRVERIVYNLLENATKYSPAMSEIRVSGRTEAGFVITEVIDQGRGISPEEQARLFEPFQQLETVARATKGAGLGLVVCKRLAEAQGGWIRLDSRVGQGSTFSFALPMRRAKR